MKADFYKAIKKTDTERVLPAKVVKVLNKQLPRGYQYVPDGKGHYVVKPSSKKTTQHFTGTVNYEKSGIPKEITQEQLPDYIYRTQKPIYFDNVKITEKGKEMDFPEIYKDPITGEITELAHDFMMFPEPFPELPPMKFETYEGEVVMIQFRRVPCEELQYLKFENSSFPALKMIWTIPEKVNKAALGPGKINISATPSKAETVKDAVLSLKIIKSFAKKKLKINDTIIGIDEKGSASKLDNQELEDRLRLWDAFGRLEQILNVKFNPGADYPEEDQQFAGELFYNFLEGKDFVYTRPFAQFHVGFNNLQKKEQTFKDIIGKPGMSFSFIGKADATLMGAEFPIWQANVLVDMTLDKIVFDDDKQGAEMYISDSPGTLFRMIRRYYRTEEEARDGMDRIYNEYTTYKLGGDSNQEDAIGEVSSEEFMRLLEQND